MPDFLISLAICILPFLVSSLVSNSPFKPLCTNSAKLNRVSLDYTNNKHNSKTKVLATLGSGNIQMPSTQKLQI
jgi:hypothetical protein